MKISRPEIRHRWRHEPHTIETMRQRAEVDPVSGCWNWVLSLNTHGYGQTTHNGARWGTHRLMFSLANPSVDIDGKTICHHCDNRACINPKQLYAGSPLSNMRDMIARGRARFTGNPNIGELHKDAKLTAAHVRKIRRLHAAGGLGYRKLANIFGVDRTTIKLVVRRMSWKHIK